MLKKFEIFCDAGTLEKEKDPIWDIICKELSESPSKEIKKRNLFTYVTKNLKKIKDEIKLSGSTVSSFEADSSVHCLNTEDNLLRLQNDFLYKPLIQELTMYPFTIFYWSFEALHFSSELPNDTVFYFGRIGNCCQNFIRMDGSCSDLLFFNCLGAVVNDYLIPLCQVISEETSYIIFNRFLFECIKMGLSLPACIETDFLHSYHHSAHVVFNVNLTYEKYLVMCFLYLQGKETCLPNCIIKTNNRF